MEYVAGCNVFEYMQRYAQAGQKPRLNEVAARFLFQQLIIAVDYCHRQGVYNRDIKLQNTLLMVRGCVCVGVWVCGCVGVWVCVIGHACMDTCMQAGM